MRRVQIDRPLAISVTTAATPTAPVRTGPARSAPAKSALPSTGGRPSPTGDPSFSHADVRRSLREPLRRGRRGALLHGRRGALLHGRALAFNR